MGIEMLESDHMKGQTILIMAEGICDLFPIKNFNTQALMIEGI
jgi:hypothetical protein